MWTWMTKWKVESCFKARRYPIFIYLLQDLLVYKYVPYHIMMKLLFLVSHLGPGQSAFRCKSIRYLCASWHGLVAHHRPSQVFVGEAQATFAVLTGFWQKPCGTCCSIHQASMQFTQQNDAGKVPNSSMEELNIMHMCFCKTRETNLWGSRVVLGLFDAEIHHHPTLLQHVSPVSRPLALSAHEQLHSEVYPRVRHKSQACRTNQTKINKNIPTTNKIIYKPSATYRSTVCRF